MYGACLDQEYSHKTVLFSCMPPHQLLIFQNLGRGDLETRLDIWAPLSLCASMRLSKPSRSFNGCNWCHSAVVAKSLLYTWCTISQSCGNNPSPATCLLTDVLHTKLTLVSTVTANAYYQSTSFLKSFFTYAIGERSKVLGSHRSCFC